ncbi:MAG: hypothetical protein AB7I30_03995 [Isosphaeraceae bacterium]
MAEPSDPSTTPGNGGPKPRRERSTRYPGVTLAESLKFCESIQDLGVDGLSSSEIATALGYRNIKTNTFSARLSAARQFGLLQLTGDGYALTPLAQAILHPVDPAELPSLYRQALLKPPLYAELAERLGGKKVPDPTILGNVLYHHHDIIATAKQAAAEAFLESARFAETLGDDQVFHPQGEPRPNQGHRRPRSSDPPEPARTPNPTPRDGAGVVRLDLDLWDADEGKRIRLRAPRTITAESFDRFLQAFRLLVRIEPPSQD